MTIVAERHQYETTDGFWITVACTSEEVAAVFDRGAWFWAIYRRGRIANSADYYETRGHAEEAARMALADLRIAWPDERPKTNRRLVDW